MCNVEPSFDSSVQVRIPPSANSHSRLDLVLDCDTYDDLAPRYTKGNVGLEELLNGPTKHPLEPVFAPFIDTRATCVPVDQVPPPRPFPGYHPITNDDKDALVNHQEAAAELSAEMAAILGPNANFTDADLCIKLVDVLDNVTKNEHVGVMKAMTGTPPQFRERWHKLKCSKWLTHAMHNTTQPPVAESSGMASADGEAKAELATCTQWKDDFHVQPGVSWGSLPSGLQRVWAEINCEKLFAQHNGAG